MKKVSIKLQLALFLTLFLALVAFQERSIAIFLNGLIAVAAAVIADSAVSFTRERKFKLSESAIITGLLIGFILSAGGQFWSYPSAAVLAILSKHLIRIKGKHIFNPAAFGALATLFLFGNSTGWYGAYIWYLVIPFGLYFSWRIKRLPIVAAFYLTALPLYAAQAFLQKVSFADGMLYLNHFFVLFMLIEPKTSPFDKRAMICFGVLASALCFSLTFTSLPYSGELPALLFINAVNFIYQRMKGAKP